MPEKKRSFVKICAYCLSACVLLLLLVALCLPMLFSSAGGKKMLLKMISNRTGMQIEIQEMSLHWFGIQSVQGLHVQKIDDQLLFDCKLITSDASLWKIMLQNDVGHLNVSEPFLQVTKPFSQLSYRFRPPLQAASLAGLPELSLQKIDMGFKGHMVIQEGKIAFNSPGLDPISFDRIAATLDNTLKDELVFSLNCKTLQQDLTGQIAIQGSATEFNRSFPVLSVQSTITQLPVRGVDQFVSILRPDFNGVLTSALGPTIDLQCTLNASKGNVDLSLNAQSPQLTAQIATQSTEGMLTLKSPATVNFTLTPAFFQKMGKTSFLSLTQPVPLQITLSQFSSPMPTSIEELMSATFQAKVTTPPQIPLLLNAKSLSLNALTVSAQRSIKEDPVAITLSTGLQTGALAGSVTMNTELGAQKNLLSFNASKLPIDFLNLAASIPLSYSDLLGPTFDITGTVDLGGKTPQLHMVWDSQQLKIAGLDLSLGNTVTLLSPSTFTYFINPKLLPEGNIKLAGADPIQGTLQALRFPLDNMQNAHMEAAINTDKIALSGQYPLNANAIKAQFSVDGMKFKGQISSSEMIVGAQDKQVTLQNISAPFQFDGQGKTASLQISSQVKNPLGDTGSLQGQLNLSQFSLEKGGDLSAALVQGSLDLKNSSSALLDAFSGKAGFSGLVGPTFNSTLKLQSTPDKQTIGLKWASPNLNFDTSFVMDQTSLQLQGSNSAMQWTLTPEAYQVLDRMITGPTKSGVPFEIKGASVFTITLSKLLLPVIPQKTRFPEVQWELNKWQVAANIRNPILTFFDKTSKETILLSSLSFSLNKSGNTGPLMLSLDSGVQTQGIAAAKNGSLSLNGKLEQTTNSQGVFDLSKLTGNFQMKVDQFPSRALDIIARTQGRTDFPFTTLFGTMVNANLSATLKEFAGPVSLNIHSPLTRASLNGTLAGGGLSLIDDIHAQLKLTPEMSRLVFKKVNPLNLSSIYSQDPITLVVPARGFNFPIHPLNKEKILIPSARIELGKIACRNEGNVNIALGLLKSKQFNTGNDLILWFAPIDLAVKKGYVDIERTEILLADTFDICVFGNYDLMQNYVDMTLGLTADTLRKAFGIKKLPEDYVLTIPMRGPADNVQINTGKATAKVALLLAWQQKEIAGAFGGGPAGAIVGGLLDKMATLPDSGARVPPAKHPFPWEVSRYKKNSHEPHEKMRRFKQDEKPLKQILKVIR